MLKNLSVRLKFIVILTPVIVLVIGLAIAMAVMTQSVKGEVKEVLYDELYKSSTNLINADRDFYQAVVYANQLQVRNFEKDVKEQMIADCQASYDLVFAEVQAAVDTISTNKDAYSKLTLRTIKEKNKETVEESAYADMTFEELNNAFIEEALAWDKAYDLKNHVGDILGQQAHFDQAREYLKTMEAFVDAYASYELSRIDTTIGRRLTAAHIFIAIVIIIVAFLLLSTISNIIKGIAATKENIVQLANKNLKYEPIEIDGNDEIGEMSRASVTLSNTLRDIMLLINSTSNNINEVTEQLNTTSHDVMNASNEITTAINEIAGNVSLQAMETNQASEQTKVLGSIVVTSNNTAESLAEISRDMSRATEEGMQMVEQLQADTEKNNDSFGRIFEAIEGMEGSAKKIAEASSLISGVASQTSLLSLNASIEAARAGEAGRGFAVVAEEIRQLSDQSTQAVATIDKMLGELDSSVRFASQQKAIVEEAVRVQAESVITTGNKYREIVARIEDINRNVATLDGLSQDMDRSCGAVVEAVNSLSDSASSCAASSEETSASTSYVSESMGNVAQISDNIYKLAEELKGILVEFQI